MILKDLKWLWIFKISYDYVNFKESLTLRRTNTYKLQSNIYGILILIKKNILFEIIDIDTDILHFYIVTNYTYIFRWYQQYINII